MRDAPAASAATPASPAPPEKARSAMMSGIPEACTIRAATGLMSSGTEARPASAAMISKERRGFSAGARGESRNAQYRLRGRGARGGAGGGLGGGGAGAWGWGG